MIIFDQIALAHEQHNVLRETWNQIFPLLYTFCSYAINNLDHSGSKDKKRKITVAKRLH